MTGKEAIGLGVLAIVVLAAIGLGPLGIADDPSTQRLRARLQPPLSAGPDGARHVLGTDHLGRDLLARTVAGARVSLPLAVGGMLGAALLGIAVGLASGIAGGRVDHALMAAADTQLALPFTLVALTAAAISGPSVAMVLVVLAATGWVPFARLVRIQAMSVREMDFVQAARGLGCGPLRVAGRHILPHCLASVVVIASFAVAHMIVAEATISFLGVGVPPSVPTGGLMMSEGRTYLPVAWWVVMVPGVALTATTVALNLLGDAVRDRLDPRRPVRARRRVPRWVVAGEAS